MENNNQKANRIAKQAAKKLTYFYSNFGKQPGFSPWHNYS